MPKFQSENFRDVEEYRSAIETFARFSGLILIGFADHPAGTRHLILQNAIARTIMNVRGVMALWDIKDFQDCWALHRSLLDRYFHLVALGRTNSYEAFDDWSFMKQYEAQNNLRSDARCQEVTKHPNFTPTPEQKARYHSLTKSKPNWKRPKPEAIAKESGLDFLYRYSYDFASTHVHPMANDGQEDFYTITKLEPKPDFPSYISVLHNSLLVGCLLVTEAMRQSDFLWRRIVSNFYDDLLQYLEVGLDTYKQTFVKIASQGPGFNLCEPNSGGTSLDESLREPGRLP